MWNTFINNNDVYIIKITNDSAKYKAILSNFVSIWVEELFEEDFVNRCKTLNPLINTDNATYINTVVSAIKNKISENSLSLNKTDENVILEYKTKLVSTSFKFTFEMKLCSDKSFCTEVTIPAVQTIQYLELRQKQLCELLAKKDKEIEQHIFENGTLKRKDVITDKFDQNLFDSSTSKNLCCNIFSSSDELNKALIAKYGCAEPELLKVKKEEKTCKKKKISVAKKIVNSKRCKIVTKTNK